PDSVGASAAPAGRRQSMSRTVRSRLAAPELRAQWQRRSAASGWAFPSDWYLPAVDAVCETMCSADTGVWAAAERLGRDRAAAGVSLAETLADVDVLVSLASSCGDAWGGDVLVRAASLGWADGAAAP